MNRQKFRKNRAYSGPGVCPGAGRAGAVAQEAGPSTGGAREPVEARSRPYSAAARVGLQAPARQGARDRQDLRLPAHGTCDNSEASKRSGRMSANSTPYHGPLASPSSTAAVRSSLLKRAYQSVKLVVRCGNARRLRALQCVQPTLTPACVAAPIEIASRSRFCLPPQQDPTCSVRLRGRGAPRARGTTSARFPKR